MFDVGFAELFLLALIGLLVLGPERLPKAARTLGALVRKARTSWYTLRTSIESELAAADITDPLKSAGRELKAAGNDLKDVARRIDEIHAGPASSAKTPNTTAAEEAAEPGKGQAGEDPSGQ
jgi:sec-independent protein translocase protein TatB